MDNPYKPLPHMEKSIHIPCGNPWDKYPLFPPFPHWHRKPILCLFVYPHVIHVDNVDKVDNHLVEGLHTFPEILRISGRESILE